MARTSALYVVRDIDGEQWLCPQKPLFVKAILNWWSIEVNGNVMPVCKESGCIKLPKPDRLDECCFEGTCAKKAFRVTVVLE